ncbi:hypothetical protein NDQ38_05505 [Lactiplantibacillus plantarum]|uniref:hypothetical protein n=1 Tax=Lactiplantibacillus plantarum TaxID=1590 RepID=UPI00204075EF|nr:hypothetical protein [Lactiplantibacillus plantarum]MCM2634267.1 hypothetical protein [Lactiplantibacillus plantarum]
MADKWPLNLVQLVVGYFDTGTLSETSEGILYFVNQLFQGVQRRIVSVNEPAIN